MNEPMTLAQRIQIEKDIATKIVDDALARDYSVSVFDSEEWTVKKSRDRNEIIQALMTTDEDTLSFNKQGGERIGWVYLVYGNTGWDVICDYIVNDDMEKLLTGAETLAEKFNNDYPNG